ncbi:MAG TPA: hypothetical protein HA349_08050 [Methanotrichaceae archaeon]|nr:hypothetical protein [Methanotrichaceae archaeon]
MDRGLPATERSPLAPGSAHRSRKEASPKIMRWGERATLPLMEKGEVIGTW